jgi:DNA end-binding protein Ku
MPRRGWRGPAGPGYAPAPFALSPAARHDDITLDGVPGEDGRECDSQPPEDEHEEGKYVIVSDKGVVPAELKTTHAVDIFAFVGAQEIPTLYFETPYHLAPAPGGEKVYALLRETLRRTRKIGIAYVVIQMRRQLAALVPQGDALVLTTLRCASEASTLSPTQLLIQELDDVGLSDSEQSLAKQIVDSMTEEWNVLLKTDQIQPPMEPIEVGEVTYTPSRPIFDQDELMELMDLAEMDEDDYDDELLSMMWRRPHQGKPKAAARGISNMPRIRHRRR